MPLNPTVSAIIPAYNEAGRIGRVLTCLGQSACLAEIIVVDDGSRDATAQEVAAAAIQDRRILLLKHPSNRGKGQAVFTGLQAAQQPLILLLDADLVGLTPHHLSALVEPVGAGEVEMTLGVFRDGRWNTDFSHWLTPWLTGQRCLRADLFACLSLKAAAGYGIETALTVASQQHGWRTRLVPLWGMSHEISELHRGLWQGTHTRLRMYAEIARAWYLAQKNNHR